MRAPVAIAFALALLAVPAVARAGDGVAILPLVAEDAEFVAVLDVADAHDAAMFKAGVQLMVDRASDMKDMLALVGLQLEDTKTVLIAGRYGASGTMGALDENLMAVVEGGFTTKKMTKRLNAISGVTTKKKRSVKYWITADAEAALIGKRLVVTVPGGMVGVIDRYKKKTKGLMKSKKAAALRAAVGYTDKRHDAWMAALAPPTTASTLRKQGIDMTTYSLGATLGTDMVLEVKGHMVDATTAQDVVAMVSRQVVNAKKLLGQFGLAGLASSLAVTQDGELVEIDALLTADELATVLGLMATFDP